MSREEAKFESAFAAAEAEAVPLTISELNAGKGKTMTGTREEAAAKAVFEYENEHAPSLKFEDADESSRRYYLTAQSKALAAADVHDAAHGIHRVSLDDEDLVDRAARALNPKAWDDPVMNLICHGQSPEEAQERSRDYARGIARAVLAAAVEADHE